MKHETLQWDMNDNKLSVHLGDVTIETYEAHVGADGWEVVIDFGGVRHHTKVTTFYQVWSLAVAIDALLMRPKSKPAEPSGDGPIDMDGKPVTTHSPVKYTLPNGVHTAIPDVVAMVGGHWYAFFSVGVVFGINKDYKAVRCARCQVQSIWD